MIQCLAWLTILCILQLSSSGATRAAASLIDEYANDQIRQFGEGRLLQQSSSQAAGQIGARCGNRNPCVGEGLRCSLTPGGRRYCFPMSCLGQAFEEAMGSDEVIEYQETILNDIDMSDMFNETTLAGKSGSGEEAMMDPETSKYVLNLGFRQRVVQAAQNIPGLALFQEKAQKCFPTTSDENSTRPLQNQVYYNALHIEAALGGKVIYRVGSDNDGNGNFQNICFGAGLDVDFHVAVAAGVLCGASNPDDLQQGTIMTDVDAALLVHLGGALGFTIPNFQFMAEFTNCLPPYGVGAGIGGGVGTYVCFSI